MSGENSLDSKTSKSSHKKIDTKNALGLSSILEKNRLAIALLLSAFMHGGIAFHEQIEEKYHEIVAAYDDWVKERAEARLLSITAPEVAEAFYADEAIIDDINKNRLKRIAERIGDAKRFKQKILDDPEGIDMSTVFFPLEYYSMGIEEDEMRVARELFRILNDSIEVKNSTTPVQPELASMVDTFMPPGSHNRLRSSAVYTLARHLGPGTQNCEARARLAAMSVATKYPQLRDKIFFQEWGDHMRTLVEVDGRRLVLEGPVDTFPDQLTDEYRSRVMPLNAWLQIYAGRDEQEFEDVIEYHGPPAKSDKKDFPRITDNLIGPIGTTDGLDNIGDAASWYAGGGGSGAVYGGDGANEEGKGEGGMKDGSAKDEMAENGINLLNRPREKQSVTEESSEPPKQHVLKIEDRVITPQILEALSNNITRHIYELELVNMETLDRESAKLFIDWLLEYRENNRETFRVNQLTFKNLNQFRPGAAYELARFYGELVFEGMNSLDEDVAISLGSFEGYGLKFINLKLLSAEAANGIVGEEIRQEELLLPPPPITGNSLAWFTVEPEIQPEEDDTDTEPEGSEGAGGSGQQENVRPRRPALFVDGLAGLSAEAGKELAHYNGAMTFVNCTIGSSAAAELAKTDQDLMVKEMNSGFYEGLKQHTAALSVNDRLISEDEARGIAVHRGAVRLNFVRGFEGNALTLIAQSTSDLSINTGYMMPTEALRIIVDHKGERLQIGVGKELTPEDAEIISTHEGFLALGGLEVLTPEIASILTRHNGPLELNYVQDISAETARQFRAFPHELKLGDR